MLRLHAALRGFGAHSRATFLQRTAVLAAATITATASLPGWAALKPSVTTKSATEISAGAKLNGTANPMGDTATVAFDYGTTTNFGSSIAATPASLAGSYSSSNVAAPVTGLLCATKYYFRVRATNKAGTSQASALSFTTSACSTTPPPVTTAPTATTIAPTSVTQTSATFGGNVNPGSAAVTVTFEAGYSTAYAGSIAASPSSISAGSATTPVSAVASGLACGTTYHYRVRASSSVGTAVGSDQSITTSPCGTVAAPPTPPPTSPPVTTPAATTNPATATATAATLNASVTPNGASTTVSFEHGATSAYGTTIAATPATLAATASGTSVSAALAGLACGTTYNYRVRATNSAGTTLGSNLSFATAACGTPTPPTPPTPPAAPVAGTTYYIAPSGNNANNGLTSAAPFQTFAKAWSVLQSGDALIVADGSYIAVSPPAEKSGTAEKPITVSAARAGGANLDRIGFMGNAYLTFTGFRVKGSGNAIGTGSAGAGKPSHHLVFREIGFSCTPGTLNDDACFAMGDGTHHVLLEDSWGWGGGRYTVMCYGGPGGNPANLTCDNNTFRRLVLRQGPTRSSGGNPQASLALYYSSNNVVENVIAVDGLASSDSSNSAFYITGHAPPPNADGNRYYGVIALNNLGQGFYLDCPGAVCNGTQVRDSVFWASAEYGLIVAGGSGISKCDGVVIDHSTIGASELGNGYENYACAGATLTNNAFLDNAGYGVRQSSSGGSTTGHHNGYYGNVKGTRDGIAAGTGDLVTNPALAFITRVEAGSPYKGTGSTGDIGANVLTRYQDGVPTSTSLWPWPNEARIKAEMCEQTTTGFCSASTLTRYIWEYEGRTLPTGIYP